ncbi:hypothetical protein A5630_00800 [Mycolicibacterium mucogenicum]|uniref:PE-PGRS family protein n=1 Tax=Mycolicibacterium mucogenicum TaxID=56689 RepID=A0A1A3HEN7_MYCMU|nr:hypothetical protein [Mycolicibacterium mucogenicum]OBJ46540.1 hypothetical protein A5630_00800 [Mycolicibacterium mucogenicum]
MTSGVALIGASAIALSPIVVAPQQVHLPAVPVSSVATTLTASANPISEWGKVLATSFNNISALGQQVWADPAPILKQIIANQIGYANVTAAALGAAGNSFVTAVQALPDSFRQAAQQLAAGHISNGLDLAFQGMLNLVVNPGFALLASGVLDIPGKVMQNITNVVKLGPAVLVSVGFSLLGTVSAVEKAFGDAAQAVYDGVRAGNLGAAVNAIVNAPAVLTNAFLNGYAPLMLPGILTPTGVGIPGLVATVIGLRDVIAQALGAPVPVAAKAADVGPAALPSAAVSAATVTLGAEKVTTPDTPKVTATETTPTKATPAEPAATAPAATKPDAGEPASTSSETPSTATETKPDPVTTAGSTTTPSGGTDTTSGTKTGTPGAAGEPTKPSGSTGSETGSDGASTPKGGTASGTKTGTPGKTGDGLTKAINSAGENLKSSLNKFGAGLKNGFGKPAKPSKSGSGSSSAGASGADANSAGGSK